MKTRLLQILLLFGLSVKAQKPNFHLLIAADIEDNTYAVQNFSKEEKILNMYKLVCSELDFELKTQYFHTTNGGFNAKAILDELTKIKTSTKEDIIVFYYLGRGFYANSTAKSPFLEFQDTKNMLSLEQIRKKLLPIKSRLTLVIADCDESYTITNPKSLPYSLFKSAYLLPTEQHDSNVFWAGGSNGLAEILQFNSHQIQVNEFGNQPIENSTSLGLDSLYAKACLVDIQNLLGNLKGGKNDEIDIRHLIVLKDGLDWILGEDFRSPVEDYMSKGFFRFHILDDRKYRFTENIDKETFKLMVYKLFESRNLMNFQDSLNLKIKESIRYNQRLEMPEFWKLNTDNDISYLLESFEKLSAQQQKDKMLIQKTAFLIKRLEDYKHYEIPSTGVIQHNLRVKQWNDLPKITSNTYRIEDLEPSFLNVLIDSMFIKKVIFETYDPLNIFFEQQLAYFNKPLKKPIELLPQKTVEDYYDVLEKLDNAFDQEVDSFRKRKINILRKRLNFYLWLGFPDHDTPTNITIVKDQDQNISNQVDVLFKENKLLDFKDINQLRLDSLIQKKLTYYSLNAAKEDLEYQKFVADIYQSLIPADSLGSKKQYYSSWWIKNRLADYLEFGFPKKGDDFKSGIYELSQTQTFYEGENLLKFKQNLYNPVIDSLFTSRNLHVLTHPLHFYLDSLIKNNLPLIIIMIIEKNITATNSFLKPAVMKMFLSDCGYIEISHGTKKGKNNFTDQVYNNFDQYTHIPSQDDLFQISLQKVFSNNMNLKLHQYNQVLKKECNTEDTPLRLQLADIKTMASTEELNILFAKYINTKEVSKKKALKTQIIRNFEQTASLRVKSEKVIGDSSQKLIETMPINDYFTKLDTVKPKIDSVLVKDGSVRRNENFSKITFMYIVEN